MFSRSILSNYLGSVAGLGISKGLRFFAVAFCVRMVGDYSWGLVVSTIAAFTFVGLLLDQGLGAAALLFRLRDRAADDRLLALIPRYRTLATVVFLVGLHAYHYTIHPLPELVRLYSLVLIPRAFAIDWWFQRRELYQFTLYVASVRTLLFFLLAFLFVKSGVSATVVILAEMASEGASIAFAWSLRKLSGLGHTGSVAEAPFGVRELLAFSFPFLAIGLLNAVQASGDVLMIRTLLGNAVVAEYDVGLKVGFLYFFLGAAVVQIIRPKLTRLYLENDIETAGRVLRTSSAILLVLSGLLLIPSLYFPEEIVSTLFGFHRDVSTFTFRWAAMWIGVSFVNILCADTLLSLGRRRSYTTGALICAICNIALNAALLGSVGGRVAIVSKITAEVAFFLYAWLRLPAAFRREIFGSLMLQGGILLGFATTYFISVEAGSRPLGIAVSLLLLGLGALAAGVFSRNSLSVLREN